MSRCLWKTFQCSLPNCAVRGVSSGQKPRSEWRTGKDPMCSCIFRVLYVPLLLLGKGRRWEQVCVACMTLVPVRTKSHILWSCICPSVLFCVGHLVVSHCNFFFYWIRPIRLYSKAGENAASPTKRFPLYLKGLSFSLLWGKEKERVRERMFSALYLDFSS